MAQSLEFETVDVFTQTAYEGNPLAIVHVPSSVNVSQEQKGKIAKEFNLSETIFIHENAADPLDRKMDIFIPAPQELPFAGHPTIGALSHIGKKHVSGSSVTSITLHVKAGDIKATFDPSSKTAVASIPHNVHIHQSVTAAAIGEHQTSLASYWQQHKGRKYPLVSPVKGIGFVLVDLDDVTALGRGMVQTQEMTEIHDRMMDKDWQPAFMGAYYFVVNNAKTNADGVHTLDIRTRMFCHDVPEDPATGAAACTLAGYLSIRRRQPQDQDAPWMSYVAAETASQTKYRYEILQGVEMGRKSSIIVEVIMKSAQGTEIDEIKLQGQAVKVMEGKLQL